MVFRSSVFGLNNVSVFLTFNCKVKKILFLSHEYEHLQYRSKVLVGKTFLYIFERSLLYSPRLHLSVSKIQQKKKKKY